MREHYETFVAEVDGLPQFVKDEFAAYLDCGILACGFLRLTCEGCARDTLVAFSCKRRGICWSGLEGSAGFCAGRGVGSAVARVARKTGGVCGAVFAGTLRGRMPIRANYAF